MSRFQLVEYDDASPEVRAIYEEFLRTTGSFELPYWVKSLGHSELIARTYWEKVRGTLVLGDLPLIMKELIIFVVSVANGSRYCTACHAHAALQLDGTLTYEDLVMMTQNLDGVVRPPAHRAALKFADKAARDGNLITDEDFASLTSVGFTAADVAEIISTIDLAMMFNCYTKVLQLPLDPHYRPILSEVGADDQRRKLAN